MHLLAYGSMACYHAAPLTRLCSMPAIVAGLVMAGGNLGRVSSQFVETQHDTWHTCTGYRTLAVVSPLGPDCDIGVVQDPEDSCLANANFVRYFECATPVCIEVDDASAVSNRDSGPTSWPPRLWPGQLPARCRLRWGVELHLTQDYHENNPTLRGAIFMVMLLSIELGTFSL